MRSDKLNELIKKPAEVDWEEIFLGDVVSDMDMDYLNQCRELPALAFEDYNHRKTWQAIKAAATYEEVMDLGMAYLGKGSCGMKYYTARQKVYLHALAVMGFEKVDKWRTTLPAKFKSKGPGLEALEARRLNLSAPPPRPEPVLLCAGVPVATRGDISAILAPAKSGKSALCGAIIAAAVVSGEGVTTPSDCLGIVAGARPAGSVVLLFDTEQSEADQFDLAQRAARRAGVEVLPDWVVPYNLVGAAPGEIRAMITAKLAGLKADGVPVWFVVIDGIADLCEDPNDLSESQELVREVHGHAREAACPIIAVIHRNEGRDADASARGHLGKQLARKAAFNLTLEKDPSEVTVVFSTKNRGAPILKKDGPRFAWSDEAKMHASVAGAAEGDDLDDLLELAKDVFVKADQLTHADLHAGIKAARGKGKTWADVRIKELKLNDIIRASGGGKYVMV
jgi:hypothetical protein